MGSVTDLYTTGDNDPQIEPRQYYRHYLYCDECGSFDLTSWEGAEDQAIERTRKKLGAFALYTSPLVAVSAWHTLGFVLPLSVLLTLITGMTLALLLWMLIWKFLWKSNWPISELWHFFKRALIWLLIVGVTELLTEDLPSVPVLAVGGLVVAGLLAWRQLLNSRIQNLGMRCNQCNATHAHGSSFFTHFDANPRGLTISDVPRPLGVSHFETGQYVDPAPPEQTSSLP